MTGPSPHKSWLLVLGADQQPIMVTRNWILGRPGHVAAPLLETTLLRFPAVSIYLILRSQLAHRDSRYLIGRIRGFHFNFIIFIVSPLMKMMRLMTYFAKLSI